MSEFGAKQTMAIVVSRHQLKPNLIPPLKIIMGMLQNLIPIKLYTSLNREIRPRSKNSDLYTELVEHLENEEGECNLTQTLSSILTDFTVRSDMNFRACIIGNQDVSWGIIMEYRRKGIVIDTAGVAGKTEKLVQISDITAGIHRQINEKTIVKVFLCDFQMSTQSRQLFKPDNKKTVKFTLQCCLCKNRKTIRSDFLSCSVCLAVYCADEHSKIKKCANCDYTFDF